MRTGGSEGGGGTPHQYPTLSNSLAKSVSGAIESESKEDRGQDATRGSAHDPVDAVGSCYSVDSEPPHAATHVYLLQAIADGAILLCLR